MIVKLAKDADEAEEINQRKTENKRKYRTEGMKESGRLIELQQEKKKEDKNKPLLGSVVKFVVFLN